MEPRAFQGRSRGALSPMLSFYPRPLSLFHTRDSARTSANVVFSLVPFAVAAYPLSLGFSPRSPSPPSSSILFPPLPSWPPPHRRLRPVRQGTARTHTWARKAERGTSRFGLAAGERVTDLAVSLSLCVLQGCTLQRPPRRRSWPCGERGAFKGRRRYLCAPARSPRARGPRAGRE